MASQVSRKEHEYPACFFGRRRGCGIDYGGSLIKVITLEPKDEENDLVRAVTFDRSCMDKALDYISSSCGDDLAGKVMYTTGVGCHQHKDTIINNLKVSTTDNISEMDCFVAAFQHMVKNHPLENITHPQSKVAEEYIAEQFKRLMAFVSKMQLDFGSKHKVEYAETAKPGAGPPPGVTGNGGPPPGVTGSGGPPPWVKANGGPPPGVVGSGGPPPGIAGSGGPPPWVKANGGGGGPPTGVTGSGGPPSGVAGTGGPPTWVKGAVDSPDDNDSLFPCVLAILGSGSVFHQVEADGSFKMLDGTSKGGKTLLSLGSLLTDVKDFETLIKLAEKGDNLNVDVSGKHLKTGDEGDIYSLMPDDVVLYAYGQAFGKSTSDFKKEDLCLALLKNLCQENMDKLYLSTALAGIKRIFICGNFGCSSELVRDEMSKCLLSSIQRKPQFPMKFHFLKTGGHLGALGVMLKGFEKEGVKIPTKSGETLSHTHL